MKRVHELKVLIPIDPNQSITLNELFDRAKREAEVPLKAKPQRVFILEYIPTREEERPQDGVYESEEEYRGSWVFSFEWIWDE